MSVAACLVIELDNVTTEDEADWEKSEFVRRFSFDDFKDDVKRQCPCIFVLLLALMLPSFDTLQRKAEKVKSLVYWTSHRSMKRRFSPRQLLIQTYLRFQNEGEGSPNLNIKF